MTGSREPDDRECRLVEGVACALFAYHGDGPIACMVQAITILTEAGPLRDVAKQSLMDAMFIDGTPPATLRVVGGRDA